LISTIVKDGYFSTVGKLTMVNLWFKRLLWSLRRPDFPEIEGAVVLNLGSGKNYIEGFYNIDGNIFRKKDLFLDVTNGLPFKDSSIDICYCSHMLEHLPYGDCVRVAAEVFRVLKPEGTFRVVTPSVAKAMSAYRRKDQAFFGDFPEKHASIGGRFSNYLLCQNQHKIIFDFSFMAEVLKEAGFPLSRELRPDQTLSVPQKIFKLFPWETFESKQGHCSLFVEAQKKR
jgi:predicted SAM-dependent methyltransferase